MPETPNVSTARTGPPETLDELLDHYRQMAHLHWERVRKPYREGDTRARDSSQSALGAATAYSSAADTLERILEGPDGRERR